MAYSGTIEEKRGKARAYCLKNPERVKTWTANSQQKNKEKIKARQLEYRIKNKEKIKAKNRKYYTENSKEVKAYKRKYNSENREKIKNYKFKKSYGITVEDYERMYLEQWGMCAICGTQKKSAVRGIHKRKEVFHVDHCHKSGRVRALLCRQCNLILGFANDDSFVLQNASNYIKHHNI